MPPGIVYTVDRHLLGDKIEERIAALGTTAKMFRGRGADDPDNPGTDRCACDQDAGGAGDEDCTPTSTSTCCKQGARLVCPLFTGAATSGRRKATSPRSGSRRTTCCSTPRQVFGKPAAVIIDERMWHKGIRGIEHEEDDIEWTVPLDSLIKDAASQPTGERQSRATTASRSGRR